MKSCMSVQVIEFTKYGVNMKIKIHFSKDLHSSDHVQFSCAMLALGVERCVSHTEYGFRWYVITTFKGVASIPNPLSATRFDFRLCQSLKMLHSSHIVIAKPRLHALLCDRITLTPGPFFVPFPNLQQALKNNTPIRTNARSCTILPNFVGCVNSLFFLTSD